MINLTDYINDFNKLMKKAKKLGVNLNYVSATELMFYLYNCMGKSEFKAISDKVENIDKDKIEQLSTKIEEKD